MISALLIFHTENASARAPRVRSKGQAGTSLPSESGCGRPTIHLTIHSLAHDSSLTQARQAVTVPTVE